MKRTCDQLGACQSRTPACPGCLPRPAFAPGVIEHYRRQHTRALTRWMSRAAVLLALAACVAAYLHGGAL
jgi:hypothetical protein